MESKSNARVRLNKALADAGLASRRQADRLIAEGSITVNGKRVYELGVKVDPRTDKILVSGKPLKAKSQPVYAVFHKPKGILTTMEDPEGRPTIKPFIDDLPVRLFPVGRLDWDSEGLLLLTNDGDWAQKVMRPQSEVTKTYLVKVKGEGRPDALTRLRTGVSIVGGRVSAKFVEKIERGKDKYPWYKIVITEGKNRQIRLMFEKVGMDVMKLQRIAIGRLRLGSIERGRLVFLNDEAASLVFLPDMSGTDDEKRNANRQVSTKRVTGHADESVLEGKTSSPAAAARVRNKKNPKPKKGLAGRRFKGMPLAKTAEGAEDSTQSQRKRNRAAAAARRTPGAAAAAHRSPGAAAAARRSSGATAGRGKPTGKVMGKSTKANPKNKPLNFDEL